MNEIRNEMELHFALREKKNEYEAWLKELKSKRKRTYKYSDYREFWQSCQRRLVGDFKYSKEAHEQYKSFLAWREKCDIRYGIKCSKQR